jgi:hypothetical protein
MSEYQYYEFRTVDRSLTAAEIEKLDKLSSRADVTPSGFSVIYNYGDFRGDPKQLMERYFDAFVNVTNWGTRHFMVRLPVRGINLPAIEAYANDALSFWIKGDYVILSFERPSDDGGDDEWDEEDDEAWMSDLISIRQELLNGDFRSLYLGWLGAIYVGESEEDHTDTEDGEELEPPLPPGMRSLTAAQDELVRFLQLDPILVEAVSEASSDLPKAELMQVQWTKWLQELPIDKKNGWLLELLGESGQAVRSEILLEFREGQLKSNGKKASSALELRSIDQLRTLRINHEEEYERRRAVEAAREKAQEAKAAAKKRTLLLDMLAKRIDAAWTDIDKKLKSTSTNRFIQSLNELNDLRELATRDSHLDDFRNRLAKLLKRHADKTTFLERVKKAMLSR